MRKTYAKQAAKAIKLAGGMPAVAQALAAEKPKLGYQKAYGRVQKWKERGVSESGVLFLERLSGVQRTKLRPDIYD